jgi:2-polyprenyl-3-methyl-5-hydroxy-6-metoxy-1,4-benzoquinol methylase
LPKTYSSTLGEERQESVPCPGCGGKSPRPFLACDRFAFVRCRRCAMVYQDPRPVFEDLRRRYGAQYFSYELENERTFFGLMKLGLRDIRFEQLTAGMEGPRTFLDIGCATGMLVESMKGAGWEAKGVDLCRESAEYGMSHRGVSIFIGTLEEAAFPAGSFSVVHFSHLIEHVPDPRAFLHEVRRILRPGGFAVITTPNIDGFQARLFGTQWRSAIADHLTLFSKKTLGKMIRETGFEVQRTVTWGGLAAGTAPSLIKKPMDVLAKKLGFGDVFLALAAKR